jgi:hypothetical protein
MTVNLVVPEGNERETVGLGPLGHVPFRAVDSAGRVWWLIQVADERTAHLICNPPGGAPPGLYRAPEELQGAQPPGGLAAVTRFNDLRAGVRSDQASGGPLGAFAVVPIEV